MSKSKIGSFVRQTIAQMKGDGDQAIAEKNFRKAISAVQGQIHALQGQKVDLELDIEMREEDLTAAMYPKQLIGEAMEYLETIKHMENRLKISKSRLTENSDKITSMETLLAELSGE